MANINNKIDDLLDVVKIAKELYKRILSSIRIMPKSMHASVPYHFKDVLKNIYMIYICGGTLNHNEIIEFEYVLDRINQHISMLYNDVQIYTIFWNLLEIGFVSNKTLAIFLYSSAFMEMYASKYVLTYDVLREITHRPNLNPINLDLVDQMIDSNRVDVTVEQLTNYINHNSANYDIAIKLARCHPITILTDIYKQIVRHRSFDIFKLILSQNAIPLDESLLTMCCEYEVYQKNLKIHHILDNKIIPTKIVFDQAIKEAGIMRDRSSVLNRNCNYNEIVDMIIDYGYCPTYDDILNALYNGVVIRRIERFNITFDIKYTKFCLHNDYNPYKVPNMIPDMDCLIERCKKGGNLKSIKKMVNDFNLVPNTECLRAACTNTASVRTISYLLSKKAIPDIVCIENMAAAMNSRSLKFIINEYKKTITTPKMIEGTIITNKNDQLNPHNDTLEKFDKRWHHNKEKDQQNSEDEERSVRTNI